MSASLATVFFFFSGAGACEDALQFCKRPVFPSWAGLTYFNNNNNNSRLRGHNYPLVVTLSQDLLIGICLLLSFIVTSYSNWNCDLLVET